MQIEEKIKLAETYIMDFSLSHEYHDCVELLRDYVEILKNKKEWKDRYIFDFEYDDYENCRYNKLEFKLSVQIGRYTIKEINDLFKKSILELKDNIIIYNFEQIFYFPISYDDYICYITLKELFNIIDNGKNTGYGPVGENTIEYVVAFTNLTKISGSDRDIQWGNQ